MQTNLRSLQEKINDLQSKLKKVDDKQASISSDHNRSSVLNAIAEIKNTTQ